MTGHKYMNGTLEFSWVPEIETMDFLVNHSFKSILKSIFAFYFLLLFSLSLSFDFEIGLNNIDS